MYHNILVAIDGSKESNAALQHAAEVSSNLHSNLIIVHAIKEIRTISSTPVYSQPVQKRTARKRIGTTTIEKSNYDDCAEKERATSILKKAREQVDLPDSQVKTKVLYGEAAKIICEYAKRKEVDLIVMGSRGIHDLRKTILGSVSQKVAKSAHCPVTITK